MKFQALIVAGLLVLALPSQAQDHDFSKVEVRKTQLTENIFMFQGAGGNLGVLVGNDGILLIDDDYAPLSEKIQSALKELDKGKARFVINTHWHGDHSGGNEAFAKNGSVIVAHRNVRERMSTEQFIEAFDWKVPASPEEALPVITFDSAMSLHFNGEELYVFHPGPGHTDGDSILHFRSSNVIHTGDLFFNGFFPFIDTSSGGSLTGMIAGGKRILVLADEETQIIPGHGPLATRKDLEEFVAMLEAVKESVQPLVQAGKSKEEVVAAKPLAHLNEKWGQGFLNQDVFTSIVYTSLQVKKKQLK